MNSLLTLIIDALARIGDPEPLAEAWVSAKAAETEAKLTRQHIEDRLLHALNMHEPFEGTQNAQAGSMKIKVVGRMNRKVDSELLAELAAENGLEDYVTELFRWKADVKLGAWRNADETVTKALSQAITTEPGRATFTITGEDV